MRIRSDNNIDFYIDNDADETNNYFEVYENAGTRIFYVTDGGSGRFYNDLIVSGELSVDGTGDSYVMGSLGVGTATPTSPLHVSVNSGASSTPIATITEGYDGGNVYALTLNSTFDRDIGITLQQADAKIWKPTR